MTKMAVRETIMNWELTYPRQYDWKIQVPFQSVVGMGCNEVKSKHGLGIKQNGLGGFKRDTFMLQNLKNAY